jgi:hypothetical protein
MSKEGLLIIQTAAVAFSSFVKKGRAEARGRRCRAINNVGLGERRGGVAWVKEVNFSGTLRASRASSRGEGQGSVRN